MSNRRPLIIIVVALVALACACVACGALAAGFFLVPQRASGATSGEYSGYYTSGFEVSAFVPCGESSEAWWLSSTRESGFFDRFGDALALATPPATSYNTVFTRFRGSLSARGAYGHLGAYTREVTVTEVLEISLDGVC